MITCFNPIRDPQPTSRVLPSPLSLILIPVLFLQGCYSYTVVQRNIFSDEDGYVVTVDYGRSEREHVNTFVSPMTGREMDFRSRLLVLVELPDGREIKAWQCMNFQRTGTMYRTDNDEWMVWANGFSCVVYRQAEGAPQRYREVYRGVLCESPKMDVEKNDKWKVVPRLNSPRERAGGTYEKTKK